MHLLINKAAKEQTAVHTDGILFGCLKENSRLTTHWINDQHSRLKHKHQRNTQTKLQLISAHIVKKIKNTNKLKMTINNTEIMIHTFELGLFRITPS